MSTRTNDFHDPTWLLNLVSRARRGPGGRIRLTPAQIEQVARTVRRAPEVVVKVLPKGCSMLKTVRGHIDYIGRRGDLELETDDGSRLEGRDAGRDLLDDWDLDLESKDRVSEFSATRGRNSARLVHKLMFSMPPGTSPEGVLTAARSFAREEFALKHRYVFALHTDEPHPHVHMVVKAVSEQGVRLNVRKDTLREWRQKFASHLRDQGIDANATDRAVRGRNRIQKLDAIYRAAVRGESTHARERIRSVYAELTQGRFVAEPGKAKLLESRSQVERGWRCVQGLLIEQGHAELAAKVGFFIEQMPKPRTEKELIAADFIERTRQNRARELARTR